MLYGQEVPLISKVHFLKEIVIELCPLIFFILWIPYVALSIAAGTQVMHSLLLLLVTPLLEAEAVCGTDWKNADDPN